MPPGCFGARLCCWLCSLVLLPVQESTSRCEDTCMLTLLGSPFLGTPANFPSPWSCGDPAGQGEEEEQTQLCVGQPLCSVWRSSFRFLDRGRNRCCCVPAFSPTIECVLLTATRFYGDWLLSVCFWELLELRFEWAALLGKLFYENRTSHLQGCAVLHTTSPCSV